MTRGALGGGAVLATCVLLAACGSTSASSGGGAGSSSAQASAASNSVGSSSPGTASAAKVSLDVTFTASANSPAVHYTLRCEPPGGTTPDPAAACASLLTGTSIFAPLAHHVMCPMILAGAGHATVTGTYLGENVHVTIINGGCDLSRWGKLRSIFR